jgi:phosphoesterase RecJ-like protein
MISTEILDRTSDLLRQAGRPLLVTHIAPDGDAAGSLLGMGWALRALGQAPILACQDPLPRRYDYLPGFEEVVSGPGEVPFDLVVALDCSDVSRLGSVVRVDELGAIPLLNVDHHVTNLRFGVVNLVDAKAVSTTEILTRVFRHLEVQLDARIANCLLTGLVTDTRGFRTANVTADVLRTAVELMTAGASLPTITRNGLDRRPLEALRLWGAALDRLQFSDGVAWTSLPLEVQNAKGAAGNGVTGLTNMLIGVEGACMVAVFTEREDRQVEVGFRAVPGFDVAGIALGLGGGGHKLASGCLVPGPLEEAERQVLAMLREDLYRQRRRISTDDQRHPQSE